MCIRDRDVVKESIEEEEKSGLSRTVLENWNVEEIYEPGLHEMMQEQMCIRDSHLIEAFRSTLEEAKYADIILHVVDASNPQMDEQMYTVYETLQNLGVKDKDVYKRQVHGCPTSSAHYASMMGKTIDSIEYYTTNGLYTIDVRCV